MEENTKTRQEEAFDYIAETFLKLIQRDKTIHHKKEVLAFWHDFFEHEGVRNNMLQAINNFLWEIDGKLDAARKAGIDQLRTVVLLEGKRAVGDNGFMAVRTIDDIANRLLEAENAPEETVNATGTDLSEVGGGDEDDTPLM